MSSFCSSFVVVVAVVFITLAHGTHGVDDYPHGVMDHLNRPVSKRVPQSVEFTSSVSEAEELHLQSDSADRLEVSSDYDSVERNGNPFQYYKQFDRNSNRKVFSAEKKSALATMISPLAGIAFVAAAAAVALNPVYLTVSSSGRMQRDLFVSMDPPPRFRTTSKVTSGMMEKIHELQTLEKYLASVPKETDYQQQIMSMYLSCSGYTNDSNLCLDRVFCEYGNAESRITEEERDVLSIVLYNIMSNQFIPIDYKRRLRSAARVGRDFKKCGRYECPLLSDQTTGY